MKNRAIILLLSVLFCLGTASALWAQSEETDDPFADTEGLEEFEDFESFDDLDSLFNLEEAVEEVEEPMADLGEDLEEPGFVWGGRFDSEYTSQWGWNGDPPWEDSRASDKEEFTPELSAELYFDSRPEDFRVFGKLDLSFPENEISIKELFADFDWKDQAYFRAGKQTVNWGVGYLYSPADVINLTPIDPLDFEAEREGPIAWKTQVPVDKHNAYFYVLYTGEEDQQGEPEDLAFAPKVEVVLGTNELGLGGYFQNGRTPKGMATITGPVGDFDYFGELLVQYGSDTEFYKSKRIAGDPGSDPSLEDLINASYDTEKKEEELFFAGTAGINYWRESMDFRLLAQYYYDQERFSFQHPEEQGLHQGAVYLSYGTIRDSDFDLTALWMGVLSEAAGFVRPEIIWRPLEAASVSAGVNYYYGDYVLHTAGVGLLPEAQGEASNTQFEVFLTFRLGYGGF